MRLVDDRVGGVDRPPVSSPVDGNPAGRNAAERRPPGIGSGMTRRLAAEAGGEKHRSGIRIEKEFLWVVSLFGCRIFRTLHRIGIVVRSGDLPLRNPAVPDAARFILPRVETVFQSRMNKVRIGV